MQKTVVRKVCRLLDRMFAFQKGWCANGLDHFPRQSISLVTRPASRAVLDVEVKSLVVELVAPDAGDQTDFGIGVAIKEALKPGRDPVDGITDRRAHRQHLGAPEPENLFGARRQAFETVADLGQIGRADFGQHQAARFALEQGFAQVVLQKLHLLADRGLGQVQLLRGIGETQMPRRCLKSAQPAQMGKASGVHGQLMHKYCLVIG